MSNDVLCFAWTSAEKDSSQREHHVAPGDTDRDRVTHITRPRPSALVGACIPAILAGGAKHGHPVMTPSVVTPTLTCRITRCITPDSFFVAFPL